MLVSSLPSPAPGHRDHPPTRRPTSIALSQWILRLPPAPLLTRSTALHLHVSSPPSNNRNPLPHRQLADSTHSRLLDGCQRGFQFPGRGTCHACPAWPSELRQGRAEVILGEHLQQEVGGWGWGVHTPQHGWRGAAPLAFLVLTALGRWDYHRGFTRQACAQQWDRNGWQL